MKRFQLLVTALATGLMIAACGRNDDQPTPQNIPSVQRAELNDTMRKLWNERVFWNRSLIVTTLGDQQDQQAIIDRLRQNQAELSTSFTTYYGADTARELTRLLEQDQTRLASTVSAAKQGARLDELRNAWKDNARELANFFNEATPEVSEAALARRLEDYTDRSFEQIEARLGQDWAADIKAYDQSRDNALQLGDELVEGLAQQFSDQIAPVEQQKLQELRQAQRRVWMDHLTWTHFYIADAVAGLPSTLATTDRLLQNQADLGDSIKPYYGLAAGDQLTALLREHINGATRALAAASSGDQQALGAAQNALYANGDQIAQFLATANPNLDVGQLQAVLRTHVDQVLADATTRLTQDWAGNVKAFDDGQNHVLGIADTLSAEIAQQFPGELELNDSQNR